MARIFISYRRIDTAAVAGRVYDHLTFLLGKGRVFKDVYSVSVGRDFRDHVGQEVAQSDAVLVLIGDHWLDATDKYGNKRLSTENDPVRYEIEQALELGITVIPVLVEDAVMPDAKDLPETLQSFAYLHATRLRDADFEYDFGRLCDAMKPVCGNLDTQRRRKRRLAFGIAVAVLLPLFVVGPWLLDREPKEVDSGQYGDLQKRLSAMEDQAQTLRSELLALKAEQKADLVSLVNQELTTRPKEAFSASFRSKIEKTMHDPSLAEEEKADLLKSLMLAEMRSLDSEIERQARNAQSKQGASGPSIDVETMKLKRLIDKRSQMFDLLRQIIDNHNASAKSIIQSIGR